MVGGKGTNMKMEYRATSYLFALTPAQSLFDGVV
jgi:hypothetical protein